MESSEPNENTIFLKENIKSEIEDEYLESEKKYICVEDFPQEVKKIEEQNRADVVNNFTDEQENLENGSTYSVLSCCEVSMPRESNDHEENLHLESEVNSKKKSDNRKKKNRALTSGDNMETPKLVLRTCLLYEFKRGSKAAEAARRICTAFGEDEVSERTAQKWFKRFLSGNESLEDTPRKGRPMTIDNNGST